MQHWMFLLHDTNTKANLTAIVNSAVQPVWLATSYGWYVTTYDNIIGFCYSFYHMALCNFGYILRVALAHGLLSSEHLGLRNGDFGELNNSFLCDEEKRVEQHPSKTRHDKVGVHKKWAIDIYFLLQVHILASKLLVLFNTCLDEIKQQIKWCHLSVFLITEDMQGSFNRHLKVIDVCRLPFA